MRISVASIKRYKRVRDVVIEPAADAAWIWIAGKNKQGKSSVLDAITRALRGKKAQAAKPVRDGEVDAEIVVGMDTGMVVECVVLPDGTSHLEVRNADGAAIKSPQAYLDKLIGSCFIDPLEFLRIGDAKQRAMLLELIDADGKIADLDKRHAAIFDTRTEVGRTLKRAEGELERLPEVEVLTAINVAELSTERARFSDLQRQCDGLGAVAREKAAALRAAEARAHATSEAIGDMERKLSELQTKLAEQRDRLVADQQAMTSARLAEQSAVEAVSQAGRKWADSKSTRDKLDADLARADAHNRKAVEAETLRKRRADALATVSELQSRRDAQTDMLDKIGAQKVAALKAANLPVDGLGFDDSGLTLDGVPFAQASAAQRFMAALAIAAAASPGLDDVFLRDGAILDDDSLAAIAAHAEATGKRYWVEVIKHDDATITIHDGRVVNGDV